jgi:hypothetical protein
MKRAWIIGLAAPLVVLFAGIYFSKNAHTPTVQPALVEINGPALAGLHADFNRTPASLRVILLLSPT